MYTHYSNHTTLSLNTSLVCVNCARKVCSGVQILICPIGCNPSTIAHFPYFEKYLHTPLTGQDSFLFSLSVESNSILFCWKVASYSRRRAP